MHSLAGLERAKQGLEFQHILRKRIRTHRIAAERSKGLLVSARSPTQSKVDAIRIERGERAELLCDDQWRMVRQHDAAGPDSDLAGTTRNMADDDRGRSAGDPDHVVVLGQPKAAITEPLSVTREI